MHRLPAAICLALSLCAAAGFAANAEAIDEADLYDVQVMTWTPPDAKTFPPEELMDKASVLAGLVDYHERDFGGSGYDSGAGTLVLYVSSERGEELAKEAGLSEDPDIRLERVARSSAESWEILDAFANRVELQAGLVMANLSNDGQSFEFAVQKEPSGADAAALAELPGRVSVRTGLGPASRSSSDSDVSPFAGGSRFMTADEIVVTVPPSYDLEQACTSGYPYQGDVNKFMLTAGHCFYLGTSHDQGWRTSGTSYLTAGPNSVFNPANLLGRMGFFYGKTTWIDGTGTRLAGADNDYHGDLSLLNVEDAGNNIGDSIWVSNTDKRFVTTRTAPALGESLCRYGVRSRLDCQFITAKVNALLEYGDGDKLRKGDAAYLETAPSVSACSMDGDSGGPVFVPIGTGSARAVGVISGRLSAAVGCYLLFTGVEEAHQAWGGDINFH